MGLASLTMNSKSSTKGFVNVTQVSEASNMEIFKAPYRRIMENSVLDKEVLRNYLKRCYNILPWCYEAIFSTLIISADNFG